MLSANGVRLMFTTVLHVFFFTPSSDMNPQNLGVWCTLTSNFDSETVLFDCASFVLPI